MAFFQSLSKPSIPRRRFLKGGFYSAAGLAIYAGEVERHWVEVTEHDISLTGLPKVFEGMRVAQLSDIHLDEFTEPAFLRHVVERVNRLRADIVLLTGDYVSDGLSSRKFAIGAAWQCANILAEFECKKVYAILGNHDVAVGAEEVTAALVANGIPILRNAHLPIERGGGRVWLAGLDDPVLGYPDPEQAIPASIRNIPNEPVVLMCHAPDYVDYLLKQPAGRAVALMLSGHTHGGQVRLPFLGATELPILGEKYVEGWFRMGGLQLYVNRGIGTIGVPFRFNCPPEISMFTMRTA
jgi:predicted MPP superfamily phosphohydrolase